MDKATQATMRTTHRLKAVGTCPVNGQRDHYTVTIVIYGETYAAPNEPAVTTIEDILDWIYRFLATPRFQEDFTRALAAEFLATVTTVCTHAGDVQTECVACG